MRGGLGNGKKGRGHGKGGERAGKLEQGRQLAKAGPAPVYPLTLSHRNQILV